jgi:hypothetical protein
VRKENRTEERGREEKQKQNKDAREQKANADSED